MTRSEDNSQLFSAVEELLERLSRELKALILAEGVDDVLLWVEVSLFSIHGNVWAALIKQDDEFTTYALALTHTGQPEVLKDNPLYKEDVNFPSNFSISQVLERLKSQLRHSGMYEIYWYPGGNCSQLIEILGGQAIVNDSFSSWWSVVRENSKCGKPEGFVFFPAVLASGEGDQLVGGVFFALSNKSIRERLSNFYRLRALFHLVIAQRFSRELSRYATSATVGSISTFIKLTLDWTRRSGTNGWFDRVFHDDKNQLQSKELRSFFEFSVDFELDHFKGMFQFDNEKIKKENSDERENLESGKRERLGLRARHPVHQDLHFGNARIALPRKMITEVLKRFVGEDLRIDWNNVEEQDYFTLPCVPGFMFLASLADFLSKEGGSKELKMFQSRWDDRVVAGVAVQLKEASENAHLSHLHASINGIQKGGQTTRNVDDLMFVRLNRREFEFEADFENIQKTFAKHIVLGCERPVVYPLLAGKPNGYNEISFIWFGPPSQGV